jgi:hypothetical protein
MSKTTHILATMPTNVAPLSLSAQQTLKGGMAATDEEKTLKAKKVK